MSKKSRRPLSDTLLIRTALTRKTISNIALAGAIAFTGISYGCAKDETPPVIQEWKAPEWVMEDEDINLSVDVYDDKKVKAVYLQFGDGTTVPLTRTQVEKAEGEKSNWETSFRLPPKDDYSYSIVVKDKSNETKIDGKVSVYPQDADGDGISYSDELKHGTNPNKKNPVVKYALDKGLGIYLPVLARLDEDGVMDKSEQGFVDLMVLHPDAERNAPGIYAEILKLPDLSLDKYSKIDEKDLDAVDKILKLANDPKNKDAFEEILNEGIRDKRSYCAPLEALLWEAYDEHSDVLDKLLNEFSMKELIKDSWKYSKTSDNYKSDRWKEYEDVTARCISAPLAKRYVEDNFQYTYSWGKLIDREEAFKRKTAFCYGFSAFITYCLLKNGYHYDEFEKHETNAVCSLLPFALNRQLEQSARVSHAITLVKSDGQIYPVDATPFQKIFFPTETTFRTIEDVCAFMYMFPSWSFYIISYGTSKDATKMIGSEQFNKWMKDESFRKDFTNFVIRTQSTVSGLPREESERLMEIYYKCNP
ncbi:MAG: hypothetical protein FJ005_09575 [Chloroflexi bacterium]|nr:hypothetical protein [Chloroflexota bacterium]MBM4451796.1 hypothetical protein [Chloroflexota bacterium]MBM4453078.1 hypothetical protein [Chloroflexota bacterium]